MPDFITKEGDTRNAIEAYLKENGMSVDLTNCTVVFKMRDDDDNLLIDRSVTNITPAEGKIVVNLTEGELSNIGDFKAEFKVTFSSGEVETFPNKDYLEIEILEGL